MTQTRNLITELEEFGYLILNEPPLLRANLKSAYSAWGDFFASKSKFMLLGDISIPSGYIPICLANGCEMKESFYYRPEMKLPFEVEKITRMIFTQLSEISTEVGSALERSCRAKLVRQDHKGCLRIMRYPALQGEKESSLMRYLTSEGALRSPIHSDLNALTVLPLPTAPGLEVLCQNGDWRLTDSMPGIILVLVGQELEERSERRFAATIHRVRNPLEDEKNKARLSMALFVS
jgi:hypothetical protein